MGGGRFCEVSSLSLDFRPWGVFGPLPVLRNVNGHGESESQIERNDLCALLVHFCKNHL